MAFEQGAALVNLGLVLREHGDEGAVDALQRGRALLDPNKVPTQAGAAAESWARPC